MLFHEENLSYFIIRFWAIELATISNFYKLIIYFPSEAGNEGTLPKTRSEDGTPRIERVADLSGLLSAQALGIRIL